MTDIRSQIDPSWLRALSAEFQKDYFLKLKDYLQEEEKQSTIYPPSKKIFAAFNATPFEEVKVVIIGQDPYHGPGQANGLCFSVECGVTVPPSLKNIYKEMAADLGITTPNHGDLTKWAKSGVLMLNAVLTVRHREAASHRNKGWEFFTDAIIQKLSQEKKGLVFILWGNYARSKKNLIDSRKHFIIESPHPSPFSARNGFFGSSPFSRTNKILEEQGLEPIDWQL